MLDSFIFKKQQFLYNAGGLNAFTSLVTDQVTIGSCTDLLAEANDAGATGATIEDGKSGDTNFPHGDLKTLATVGEYDKCTGEMIVGKSGARDLYNCNGIL